MSGTYAGEPWANVFWCFLAGGTTATQASLDAWTNSFGGAYKTGFQPQQPGAVVYTLVQATLFQSPGIALHSSQAMTGAGAQSGGIVNFLGAGPVVSWLSSVYWRGGKPRTYLPGVLAAETTDNKTLTTTAVTGYNNAATNFHTAVNALSAAGITQTQHGFVSFFTGGTLRDPPVFFPINGNKVHHRMGTQRRRLGPWIP